MDDTQVVASTAFVGAVQNDVAHDPSVNETILIETDESHSPSINDTGESAGAPEPPPIPPVIDVEDLDWAAIAALVDSASIRERMLDVVERMEALLDQDGGPAMLFDGDRADVDDRVVRVSHVEPDVPLWIIGDLHGDLLALESALALIHRDSSAGVTPSIVFLGDLFDDGGFGLEIVLRVFELVVASPSSVCFVLGNHDEALGENGSSFTATVNPSDFSEWLNARLADDDVVRAGKLAVRFFATAPRALMLPDGLLVTHGGFPLVDLHEELRATGNWNDPRCLADFTWTRAHPRARKKMPNRTSRGSQFGHEDFAAFCTLSAELGRPVTHMIRGHDHVDERFEIYPAYATHPVLTTVALSRRLERELFGPHVRVPTVARYVEGSLPQVHRLHIPAELVQRVYPDEGESAVLIEPTVPHDAANEGTK